MQYWAGTSSNARGTDACQPKTSSVHSLSRCCLIHSIPPAVWFLLVCCVYKYTGSNVMYGAQEDTLQNSSRNVRHSTMFLCNVERKSRIYQTHSLLRLNSITKWAFHHDLDIYFTISKFTQMWLIGNCKRILMLIQVEIIILMRSMHELIKLCYYHQHISSKLSYLTLSTQTPGFKTDNNLVYSRITFVLWSH